MELIIIKGKSGVGKTTMATLLHNKLTQIRGIQLEWMEYDHWLLPLEEKDLVPDFRSVFVYKGKTIGIISHGDTSRYAKQFIRQMINQFHVDILVVCSSIDGRNWNMLNRDFSEYINDENIFDVSTEYWATDDTNRIAIKEVFVEKILNQLIKHCNKL